jgi:hypothetical protein
MPDDIHTHTEHALDTYSVIGTALLRDFVRCEHTWGWLSPPVPTRKVMFADFDGIWCGPYVTCGCTKLVLFKFPTTELNAVASVRERTIPTE